MENLTCTAIHDFFSKQLNLRKLLLVLAVCTTFVLSAQVTAPSVFDLISGTDVREIVIRTDLVQLLASTEREAEYQVATFTFEDDEDALRTFDIKLRHRGKFRLQACEFPPLKLNFPKTVLLNSGLSKHDKLKMVTHCTDDKNLGNEKVLREYLAYKLYQELSPYSYRVQLVEVQYQDTGGRISGFRRYGFIIEDTDEMVDRLKGEECETCTYSSPAAFDWKAAGIHAMFQYLIGNSDYSIPVLRNVKLVQRNLDQKFVPVGYDFDFSGLVEAPYAIPATHLGQLTVRQRIYLGTVASDEQLQEILALFIAKKESLLTRVSRFRLLSTEERREIKEYLLTFYEQVEMIERNGFQQVYQQLRQEHPMAVPDGGQAADYGVVASK